MDVKVKDFAAAQGVTDSIIYRHIRTHKDALGDNVYKQGKSTWLNDAAQAYIKDLMIKQPYALSDTGINLKIYELDQENKELLKQLAAERLKVQELMKAASQNLLLEEKLKLLDSNIQSKDDQIKFQEAVIDGLKDEKENQDKKVAELEKTLNLTDSELQETKSALKYYESQSFIDRFLNRKYKKQG